MITNTIVSINGVKALPTRPLNLDPLLSNAYKLVFAKVPNAALFTQDFNLPGLSIAPVVQANRFPDIKQIGEKITYSPFTMNFLVNAGLENYTEIVKWMKRITNNGTQKDETDTATLVINENLTVVFHNVWPSSIGDLQFVSNPSDAPHMNCSAVFEYDYWEFA